MQSKRKVCPEECLHDLVYVFSLCCCPCSGGSSLLFWRVFCTFIFGDRFFACTISLSLQSAYTKTWLRILTFSSPFSFSFQQLYCESHLTSLSSPHDDDAYAHLCRVTFYHLTYIHYVLPYLPQRVEWYQSIRTIFERVEKRVHVFFFTFQPIPHMFVLGVWPTVSEDMPLTLKDHKHLWPRYG